MYRYIKNEEYCFLSMIIHFWLLLQKRIQNPIKHVRWIFLRKSFVKIVWQSSEYASVFTHSFPMQLFSIPRKHHKTLQFFNFFQGVERGYIVKELVKKFQKLDTNFSGIQKIGNDFSNFWITRAVVSYYYHVSSLDNGSSQF